MREGFHVFMDHQNKLAQAMVGTDTTRWMPPVDIAASLIDFVEFDFTTLLQVIDALDELSIFDGELDIRYEDYLECAEICRDIAEELDDPIGSYFICRELDRIITRPDDGSASYWLYQARDMVEALRGVAYAHTFLSRAFDLCFGSRDMPLPDRARVFFKAYPDLEEHLFAETRTFLPSENGRLHYEHTLRLTRELGAQFDDYYSTLHQGREALSMVKGNLIRTHKKLLFFCLTELLRRGVGIQRCEYCGGYFVPRTKKKTLYCDRVIRDGKTCKDIAPKRRQQLKKEQDEALREFDRRYNLYRSRAERYENRTDLNRDRTENDLTYDEFYTWSARASKARQRYVRGEVSAEEFLTMIQKDFSYKTGEPV